MAVRLIEGMRELASRYDGFILDLWGVVHDGVAPLPGAVGCLQQLVVAGKQVAFLSNAPRRAGDVVRRITRIGVPEGLYHHVVSSGEEAWQHLCRRDDPFYAGLGRRCLQIGSERDLGIREGLALDFVDDPAAADFILNTGPAGWDDTVEDYAALLDRALARDLPMICANPDLVVQHGDRLALCAGALAQYYEARGGRVRWHGKPYPSVYATCLALLGLGRERVLAVGDSLRTDLAGAAAAGIDAVFVAGGIHGAEFGVAPGRTPDLARLEAALAGAGHAPVAVATGLRW